MATTRKNWHSAHAAHLTAGQRVADTVAATMGSWGFIITQSVVLALWITLNIVAWIEHWDPYPFILLNLALSFQAAYAAAVHYDQPEPPGRARPPSGGRGL